jgi:DNA-binding response OmpR family regulator
VARILIVEDEAHIARVLAMWLTRHGHEVLEASNGENALDTLAGDVVDLVITDMNMPRLDGLGLIKAMREERGLTIPILLLTARCDQTELVTRLQPYDVSIIPKPFVPSRLVADIGDLLGTVAG